MNPAYATWELLVVGIIGVAVLLFMFPGVRHLAKKSEEAEKDWSGFLIPIGVVILFVILLIMFVR